MGERDGIGTRLRRYRFYFMVDVSQSMRDKNRYGSSTPHARLSHALPSLVLACIDLPQLHKRTFLSVLSFSAEGGVVLPSTLIDDVESCDTLPDDGTFTNYERAFSFLQRVIGEDDASLELPPGWHWFNPVIFFITDGWPTTNGKNRQPDEHWQRARNSLIDAHQPNIVALGLGEAEEGTLVQVATTRNGQPLSFIDDHSSHTGGLINSIRTAILRSIQKSEERGIFDFPLPAGMRHVTERSP